MSRQRSLGVALARAIELDDAPTATRLIKVAGGRLFGMDRFGVAPSTLALRLGSVQTFDAILRHAKWTPLGLARLLIDATKSGSSELIARAWAEAAEVHAKLPDFLVDSTDDLVRACIQTDNPNTFTLVLSFLEPLGVDPQAFKRKGLLSAIDNARLDMLIHLLDSDAFEACPQVSPGPALKACSALLLGPIAFTSAITRTAFSSGGLASPKRLHVARRLFDKTEAHWPVDLAAREITACAEVLRAFVANPHAWMPREVPDIARLAEARAIHLSTLGAVSSPIRFRI